MIPKHRLSLVALQLLTLQLLLTVAPTTQAQECNWDAEETCPWAIDFECDHDLDDSCANSDCFDCDPFQEYRFDCEGCVQAGGYWCPGDALCLSLPKTADYFSSRLNVYGVPFVTSCPNETDWKQSCANGTTTTENVFNDPLYDAMAWAYKLIHVEEVWKQNITGRGVHVRVTDDGVDSTHPEFAGRFDVNHSCPNLTVDGEHGTACASILGAAANNGQGAVGIAPGVTLSACNIDDLPESESEAAVLLHKLEAIDISTNSWGPYPCDSIDLYDDDDDDDDDGVYRGRRRRGLECIFTHEHENSPCKVCGTIMNLRNQICQESIIYHCTLHYDLDPTACVEYLDLFAECEYNAMTLPVQQAFSHAVTRGRNGKGVIFTFPAGNEREYGSNSNLDGFANSRLTISVGAVDKYGKRTAYTTPGANVFVTAPAGDDEFVSNTITAKAGGGYMDAGVGTSYSTPTVAGVVALMLEANPDLTWRDVQGILAETSQQNEPEEPSWITNAAGFHHNYYHGFGLVDASKAVAAAQTWVRWKPEDQVMAETGPILVPIADDPNQRTIHSIVTIGFSSFSEVVMESVVVYIDLDHGSRGDLSIQLISPSGTTSLLAPGKRPENTQLQGEQHWKLMSVRNWGETPFGNWTLVITDESEGHLDECIDHPFEYEGVGGDDDEANNATDSNNSTRKVRNLNLHDSRQLLFDEYWDCEWLAIDGICGNGTVADDFANQVAVLNIDGVNVTGAQACCVCGGGIAASSVQPVLNSWRLVAYVHKPVPQVGNLEADVERSESKKSASSSHSISNKPSKTDEPARAEGGTPEQALEEGIDFAPIMMSGSLATYPRHILWEALLLAGLTELLLL